MIVLPTELDGVVEIRPRSFADARGRFVETWHAARYAQAGITIDWVQDNQSLSVAKGTIRGLHLQLAPHAQDKLVRVCAGRIFDVAVDVRPASPTYRRWTARELSADDDNQLLVPAGFAHGFMTLEPNCVVSYKVSAPYAPAAERSIAWDDPEIGIAWPEIGAPLLSNKDVAAPRLAALAGEL